MKKTAALLLAFVTAAAPSGQTGAWEESADAVDGIYTAPAQSPPPTFYEDDGFNDASLLELCETEPYRNFLTAREHEIVDKFGDPYLIKAIALGNNAGLSIAYGRYSPYPAIQPDKPVMGNNDHTEHTDAQLKEMGFNLVRFYMHLNWFQNVYQRNEDGTCRLLDGKEVVNWENPGLNWIRKNVQWAKKNDIRIILNMHLYQKQLWKRQKNAVLPEEPGGRRSLMISLSEILMEAFGWTEYGIHYDNLSEPLLFNALCERYNQAVANKEWYDLGGATAAQWNGLAQEIASAIRTADPNHILFVERLQGLVYSNYAGGIENIRIAAGREQTVIEDPDGPSIGVEYKKEGGYPLTPNRESLLSCFPDEYPDLLDSDGKNGCLEVENRVGRVKASVNLKAFHPKEGYEYSASADMKYTSEEGAVTQTKACVGLNFARCAEAYTLNREYLRQNLNQLK